MFATNNTCLLSHLFHSSSSMAPSTSSSRVAICVMAVALMVAFLCASPCAVSAFAFTAPLSVRSTMGQRAGIIRSRNAGARSSRAELQLRVLERRSRGTRATHARGGAGGGLSMAQESLILTEENVIAVLAEAKRELGTLFGNNAENTAVGITGDCEFVCLDGPSVVVRLTGRFWHEKSSVLARVASFVQARIPECVDVEIEDPSQLEDADPQGRGRGAEM